jgi:hypothetical protein
MTPSWLLDLAAAIMLVTAAASVARVGARPLLAGRPWRLAPSGGDVDLANALMAVAMAGMFAARLATAPAVAWEVLFGLLAAWFAFRAWADTRTVRGMAGDRCTLHVVHCAAMLYMFAGLRAPTPGGGAMSGMDMTGTAMATLAYPTLAGAFVLLLVGYCVWDLNQLTAQRLATVGRPAAGPAASGAIRPGRDRAARAFLLAPGARAGWDVVLGIAMAFMLVIMI